ncbi:MAG: methyltransferase domain-containing protein [Chthoniobacterales bacterium]|jgi:SAM-dependent methyltransferase
MKESIERHRKEWEINSEAWDSKKELREAYRKIYEEIAKLLSGEKVLEIGSGLCKSKIFIPNITTSERAENPWVDQINSAYRISSPDQSWDHIVVLDVFHHLERPKAALKEFHRALVPKGTVVIMEPDISVLGWLVYGLMHKEPVGYLRGISTEAVPPSPEDYHAMQSTAHRLFCAGQYPEILEGFKVKTVKRFAMINYILSGGFSGPNLLKPQLKPLVDSCERVMDKFPRVGSTRMLVELEKAGASTD